MGNGAGRPITDGRWVISSPEPVLRRRRLGSPKEEAWDVVPEPDHRRLPLARLVFPRRPLRMARPFGIARRVIAVMPLPLVMPPVGGLSVTARLAARGRLGRL